MGILEDALEMEFRKTFRKTHLKWNFGRLSSNGIFILLCSDSKIPGITCGI